MSNEKNQEDAMKMINSLDIAIQKAGGSIFTIERLKEMSAFDLIKTLCTNNIIFVYAEEKE
jgi:hypothetical protein